jgi:hypothetical protein
VIPTCGGRKISAASPFGAAEIPRFLPKICHIHACVSGALKLDSEHLGSGEPFVTSVASVQARRLKLCAL